jgi:Protein of unknown function (DUF1073)
MATTQLNLTGSSLGSSLNSLLMADDILPGVDASYQICKTIYLFHPIGKKMAESPIAMAQFKPREISLAEGPSDELVEAFNKQWEADGHTKTIRSVATQARVYGVASVALLDKTDVGSALNVERLSDKKISFNVLDPLNTAGSLVLNQDPNAVDFQKHGDIAVNGVRYHRSRTVTLMNEQPIYIAYTSSAFGFVGRSVYQRALFPLKSFIQTMRADDMIARKVGLIVAIIKMGSSVVNTIMTAAAAFKRSLLQIGQTDQVISMTEGEDVKSLDLTNIDGPLAVARKDILENIAAAADMPALLLNNETFAEGFGEGSEDAYKVASYIDEIREWMRPLYDFFDMVNQRRAWNEGFYKGLQSKYPEEYKGMSYEEAFYSWTNGFKAIWPSLIREPESEKVGVEDVKLKALIAAVQVLVPIVTDPANKAQLIQWCEQNFNATETLFSVPLELDYDAMLEAFESAPVPVIGENGEEVPPAPKPFSASDASVAAWMGAAPVLPLTKIQKRIGELEKKVAAA